MSHRTASCSCGQLQARTDAEPLRVSVCHCLACQRRTGIAYGVQARFPRSAVTITGESKTFLRIGDEGTKATFRFCPACGATVYWTMDADENSLAIPVGAFADPAFPHPTFSVYEERMHAWVMMRDDMQHMW